jgi:hypothetical protein
VRTRDAVRIEIRAAEIAAQMIDLHHDMSIAELVGWTRCGDNRERGSDPKSHSWQAGWLAAIIWSESQVGEHWKPVQFHFRTVYIP